MDVNVYKYHTNSFKYFISTKNKIEWHTCITRSIHKTELGRIDTD